MEAKPVAKVGAVVLLALLLGIGLYFYLAHINPNTYAVRIAFANTEGLQSQSQVLMQGVAIGEVKSISLDTSRRPLQPMVRIAVRNRFRIPVDSRFRIRTGLLISSPQIEIEPGTSVSTLPHDGSAVVTGEAPGANLADLEGSVRQTMGKLNRALDTVNSRFNQASDKIGRVLDQTHALVQTATGAVQSASRMISDPRVRTDLVQTLGNFRDVSVEAKQTTAQLRVQLAGLMKTSQGSVTTLTNRLADLIPKLDDTIDTANTMVKQLTAQVTDPRFQQALQDTAELARATLARFDQIAADIHQITGDPALQNNLKQTVSHLDQVAEEGSQTLTKVNTLLDKFNAVGKSKPHLPAVKALTNVSEQINPGHFRLDEDGFVTLTQSSFLDLGLYDLGGSTRLNLESGQRLSPVLDARFGLYASKLGVGLDYTPLPGTGLRADLYNTDRPHLDVRSLFRVNRSASLWIGGDNVLRHPAPLIGMQFTTP